VNFLRYRGEMLFSRPTPCAAQMTARHVGHPDHAQGCVWGRLDLDIGDAMMGELFPKGLSHDT
jgi:hypothetical protein